MEKIIELANNSGGTLYLMAALLLVALVVIFERGWYLLSLQRFGSQIIGELKDSAVLKSDALASLFSSQPAMPHARLYDSCQIFDRSHPTEKIEGYLEESFMHEVPRLDRSLWVLDTIITLAPLLGLFGTIVGMFQAFSVLGDVQNNQTAVTGGIAEALIATACGLFIAMLGLMFFNWLNSRLRIVVHQLETLKIMLVNRHDQGLASV
jgi:biopolymer transport protein ExbB